MTNADVDVTEPASRQHKGRNERVIRWLPSSRTLLGIVVGLTVIYLVFGPVLVLGAAILQDTENGLPLSDGATWTVDNIVTVFTAGRTWEYLLTTLAYAVGSVLLGGSVALLLAWFTERTDLPLRRTIFVLVVASAGVPGLISALAWGILLNPTAGPINDFLGWMFSWKFNSWSLAGMIFVQAVQLVPIMYLLISATFRTMNPALEEAGATSGASTWTTMRKVTLPLLSPAIIGAFIYSFVSAVGDLDVALIFGLPGQVRVLSINIYLTASPDAGLPNYGLASTYALLTVVMALVPLLIYNRTIRKSSRYGTVTGKGYRPRRLRLGALRWPAFALVFGFMLVQFLLPMLMLLWSSIQPFYDGFSSEAFDRISFETWTTELAKPTTHHLIWTTIKIGVLAALGTIVLTLLGSWVAVRGRTRFARGLDTIIFFPHLLPSIVIALAVLLVYLVLPIPVYGTIWILVIAFVLKSMPLSSRITTPGIAQISVTLEEAALVSGGKVRHVWRFVMLPLLKGTITNGSLLVFMATIQNLALPLLLGSTGTEMLASAILSLYNLGFTREVAVLSLVMVAMTAVLAALMRGSDRALSRG